MVFFAVILYNHTLQELNSFPTNKMNLFRQLLVTSLSMLSWSVASSSSNGSLGQNDKFAGSEIERYTVSFGVGYQFNTFSAHRVNSFPKAYPNSFLCQFKYSLNKRAKLGLGSNYSSFFGESPIAHGLSNNWNRSIPAGSLMNLSGNAMMLDFSFTTETSEKVSMEILLGYLFQTTKEEVYVSHNAFTKEIQSEKGVSIIQSLGGSASIHYQFHKNLSLFNRFGVYVPVSVKQFHNYNSNASRGQIRVTVGLSYTLTI